MLRNPCARSTRIDFACLLPSLVSATAKGSERGLNPASNRETIMEEQRIDIHQHITDQIVAVIEAGAGGFPLPRRRAAGNIVRPINVASKKVKPRLATLARLRR